MNDKLNNFSDPIKVLVTGVGGGSIGEQVCKSLLIGHHSYKLIVTNTTRDATKIISADAVDVLPLASSSEYVEQVLNLIKEYEVQFVIPGSEPELIKLSENLDIFKDQDAKVLINAPNIISTCVDKQQTFEFLSKNGFHIPQTKMLNSSELINSNEIPFPCIVKPSFGGGGSASTFLAQDREELSFFVHYLIKYDHVPLVQEYIPDAENEYTVGVLHNPFGDLLGTVVLRRQILSGLSNRLKVKNNTGRKEMGSTLAVSSGISQGEIVEFEPVKKTAEAIAQKLGSIGPLNIQGRWNGSDFVPFEINPRFSGTTPMRSLAGFNEPELMINAWLNIKERENSSRVRLGTCIRGLKEYFIPKDGGDTLSSV
jgi:carbamoyl-phosphate synthase large subunit